MARLGIDISAHNGDIDLAALKRNGVQFAIIRVGYGTKGTLDSKFRRNADLCKSIGLPFGFYWYSYALDVNGAAEEARHFLNAVAPYKDSYSMGCWFDMEDADGYKRKNGMPSNSTLRAMCAKFCEIVENAGYYAGIYASQSWFNNQLNGGEINRYDKWIAQWPTNGSIQKGLATPASAKSGVNLWQFTSVGRISGYNGNLDCNYAYKDKMVNGTAGGGSVEPQPQPSKSIDEIADEVIAGAWGNGEDRKNRLTAAGYDYNAVQARVNEKLGGGSTPKKSITDIANEVIAGKWGNGDDRRNRLQEAGYNYDEVQNKVNEILGTNTPKETVYVVKKGDTLSGIAAKFGTTYQAIAKKNGIKNVNKIYPRTKASNIVR